MMKKKKDFQLIWILILVGFAGNIQFLHAQDSAIDWFNRGTEVPGTHEKITCYLQAIKLDPEFIEAYYNLGYVYKNLGDFNNAEKAFRQALLTDPSKLNNENKLRITYELGITLKKLTRYAEALETLESAKNLASQKEIRAAVLYELGRAKLLMGNFEGAVAEFNEGLQLNSSKQRTFESAVENARTLREVDNWYVQGNNHLNNGQYDEAISAFTRVVQTTPNYKNALQRLASAQQAKDRQARQDNLSDVYARGIGYLQRGDWQNALVAFRQVEKIDPNYKDVKVRLTESQAKLDQVLQQGVYDKIYNDGMAEYRKGNWIDAIVAFNKVREWNPAYKSVDRIYRDAQNKLNQEGEDSVKNRYYAQAKTYLNRGEWASAVASLNQLRNMDRNYRDVQFLLQQAQAGLENEAKFSQLENYYTEAINHYNNEDWLKAIIAFEKIQQVNPNYQDVTEKLAAAQNNLDNPTTALTTEKSIKNNSSPQQTTRSWIFIGAALSLFLIPAGVALFIVPTTRARLLLIQGNYQKAALIYESILMKKPDKLKLYPLLANIYLMLNRNDETARKVYDFALQMDISPQLRQRLDELTNRKFINNSESSDIESLEQQLARELLNLKNS